MTTTMPIVTGRVFSSKVVLAWDGRRRRCCTVGAPVAGMRIL